MLPEENDKKALRLHLFSSFDEESEPLFNQQQSHARPALRIQTTSGLLDTTQSHQGRKALLLGSFLLFCASVIVFKPHLAFMVPSTLTAHGTLNKVPAEAQVNRLHHYEDSSGALASAYNATWINTAGNEVAVHVCHHRRLCIEGRSKRSRRVQYYLASNQNVGDARGEYAGVRDAIGTCFRTIHPKDEHFGLIDLSRYNKPVTWVKGKTLGFLKDESGPHPAAWGRIWTNVVSAAIRAWPVFQAAGVNAEHFFDHYQLFEQVVDLTGWNQFFMTVATSAARGALPGGRFEKLWHATSQMAPTENGNSYVLQDRQYATWADERAFLDTDGLTCFEEMVSVARHEDYYRDSDHARYLRKIGLDALGLPEHRARPCLKEDLNIVYLRRDRPVWNEREVLEALQGLGTPISIRDIGESTPFATQVDIFYSADILVSVHGSQLQNQHFMEPGSAILQFFPFHYWNVGQQKLAAWTGVDVVEMRNNSLPPRELVAQKKDRDYLARWDRVNASIPEFPTEQACNGAMSCYQSSRDLGVYVNVEELKHRMTDIISSIAGRDECRVPLEQLLDTF